MLDDHFTEGIDPFVYEVVFSELSFHLFDLKLLGPYVRVVVRPGIHFDRRLRRLNS